MIAALAEIILPVFLVIAAGYAAVWGGMFSEAHVEGLMRFTQRFAIPCLLFNAIAGIDLSAAFDPRLLLAFYAGAVISFALGVLGARALGRDGPDSVAIGFGALFSNSVLLGLPITTRAFGPDALEANFAIIAFHAPFCYALGISLMEAARAREAAERLRASKVLGLMVKNALVIGLALGFAFNFSGATMPGVVQDALDLIIRAALPAALFGLGGVLRFYRPEGDARAIALVVGLSLIVHPGVTFSLGALFALPPDALRSAVLTAAMPPGVNAYVFADLYARGRRVAATAVLAGTALAMLTSLLWLAVLP